MSIHPQKDRAVGRWLTQAAAFLVATIAIEHRVTGERLFAAEHLELVQAENASRCSFVGPVSNYLYPRSVGRTIVMLPAGSRLTATTKLGNISVILPLVFESPGPRYGDFATCRIRVRVDAQPSRELALADARAETVLAENLPDGKHSIVVEPVGGFAAIDAFRFSKEPLAGCYGTILTRDYSELLTDVRIDVFQGKQPIRSDYVRQPRTGGFELFGLPQGKYRLEIRAAGWQEETVGDFEIKGPGIRTNLGTIVLKREPRCAGGHAPGPRFGRTISVSPGDAFKTLITLPGIAITKAKLQSRFKTLDIQVNSTRKLPLDAWNAIGEATFQLPQHMPSDMYDLVLSCDVGGTELRQRYPQAVCVREQLPKRFHIAGCGHMNTWGQQTAEYLARVAEMAHLAGARSLLVANEVNAAYVSGTLAELRIPYVATAGNHSMARWQEFFGPGSRAHDDGALRIVDFGRPPYESWQEVAALFRERPQATNRVIACYESFAPLSLIREHQVDLLFDGHSDDTHPLRGLAPPRTFMMRAPDQESLRWIPMTHEGLAPEVKNNSDVPVLPIPRTGPIPLRVAFDFPNDGASSQQVATITNDLATQFPHARLRLVLRSGTYRIEGATILQSFESDTGEQTVIDLDAHVSEKSNLIIRATRD